MKFSALVIATAFALTAVSASAEGGSEFQTQTPAGKMDLTPKLTFGNSKTTNKPTGSDKVSTLNIGAEFEYGINEDFSVGIGLTNSTNTTSPEGGTDTKDKGLMDPDLFFKGKMAMGEGSFRYGTHLTISLGDHELDSSGDENMATGGHTLTPFVGYEMPCPLMGGTMGARLSHDLNLGNKSAKDKSTSPETSYKYKGGEVTKFSLFHEWPTSDMVTVGAALNIDATSKIKIVDSTNEAAGDTKMALQVYAPVKLEAATILPSFSYSKTTAHVHTIDSETGYSLDLAARFTF